MQIPNTLRIFLLNRARRVMDAKTPDVIIGGSDAPYMLRWHLIPRNRFFNVYLHHFKRSDDDRALHDHSWPNCSILLDGQYVEWHDKTFTLMNEDGDFETIRRIAGSTRHQGHIYLRRASAAHRVELRKWSGDDETKIVMPRRLESLWAGQKSGEIPVITLFITGPKIREWGFLCPQGWRHWEEFTAVDGNGANIVGKGCQ